MLVVLTGVWVSIEGKVAGDNRGFGKCHGLSICDAAQELAADDAAGEERGRLLGSSLGIWGCEIER